MIGQEIRIESIGDLIEFSFEESLREDIKRHLVYYAFRGLAKASYTLTSSLKRNSRGNAAIVEKRSLINFQKYGQMLEPLVARSIWDCMIIAQHHGVPTRLLDWTYSPLIAMHFATAHVDSPEEIDEDAAIWAIRIDQVNKMLPQHYKDAIEKHKALAFTFDMLKKVYKDEEEYEVLRRYDEDMGDKRFLFFEPPSVDARIVNQYALFSLLPSALDPLDDFLENTPRDLLFARKLILPKELLAGFRDKLDIMNINERMLFPGLDGLAGWLRRKYYHRIK